MSSPIPIFMFGVYNFALFCRGHWWLIVLENTYHKFNVYHLDSLAPTKLEGRHQEAEKLIM